MRIRLGAIGLLSMLMAGCSSGPKSEKAVEQPKPKAEVKVPDKFQVKFETTKGDFLVDVVTEWAPRGATRFHELVRDRFFDSARFYRVRPKFIVQFGIAADPEANGLWRQLKLPDDAVKQSNKRGYVTFAQSGAGSRTTQVFINLRDNAAQLDQKKFAPFGRVIEGMDVVDKLYGGYGEVQSLGGGGPDPVKMEMQGDEYIQRSYPRLDQIKSARIVSP